MPEHIRFIIRHAAFGFVLSGVFVAMLLAFDVAGLWHLVTHTVEGPIAVAMLLVFCGITFGSAQIGFKIMTMGEDDDDQGGKRDALPTPEFDAIPVPVRNDAPRA